jgi:hypothetical protein
LQTTCADNSPPAVVHGICVDKYRKEDDLREEIKRVVAHDAAHDELRRGGDARRRFVLPQLRARVRHDVARDVAVQVELKANEL